MSDTVVKQTIDVATLRAAIEHNDARTLIDMYADDAELKVMDKLHQPSHPLVLHGKEAVAGYWRDICGRAMSHTIERIARDGDTIAYSEACRYPDGTQVRCLALSTPCNSGSTPSMRRGRTMRRRNRAGSGCRSSRMPCREAKQQPEFLVWWWGLTLRCHGSGRGSRVARG